MFASIFSFNFRGRAKRLEYFVGCLVLGLILGVLLVTLSALVDTDYMWIPGVVTVIPVTMYLALAVRRGRDCDYSWKWVFALFVPIFGFLYWLVLMFSKSVHKRHLPWE